MTQLFDLSGRLALVTGGSRGLGRYVAGGLGAAGARIAITARNLAELERTSAEMRAQGIDAHAFQHDVGDRESSVRLVQQVRAELGEIDILVNNAGISALAPAEDHPVEAWNDVMNVNLNGLFFLTQQVAKHSMIPAGRGRIINISSVGGLGGGPPEIPAIGYSTSKGALINLGRALASEWGCHGINVNTICPGLFPSALSDTLPAALRGATIQKTPLRRLGGSADIEGVAVFLAAEASRHVTGQYIVVDGGCHTTLFAFPSEP